MNKSRITYRFDSQGILTDRTEIGQSEVKQPEIKQESKVIPLYRGEYTVHPEPSQNDHFNTQNNHQAPKDPQMLNQYTYDYGAWDSPFDIETGKLEQLIRETEEQNKTRDPEELNRYDPSEEHRYTRAFRDEPRYPIYSESYHSHGKSTGSPIFKIIASVSAAVVTGALFGFFALSLFDGVADPVGSLTKDLLGSAVIAPENTGTSPTIGENSNSQIGEAGGAANGESQPASAAALLDVLPQTFYVMQYGVFKSTQGAEAAVEELNDKGLAAASEEGESIAVFAGISSDRNDALLLSHQLQDRELEVYVKPFELPAVTQIVGGEALSNAAQNYFSEGRKLARSIADLTMIHLEEQNLTAIDQSALQSLHKSHQAWSGYDDAVVKGLNDTAKSDAEKMTQAMNTAVVTMEEYAKNPSTAYLWNAQSAVMQYLVAEKHLVSLVAE